MLHALKIAVAVGTVIALTAQFDAAFAKPKLPDSVTNNSLTKKQQDGLQACIQWCADHNKTTHSRMICVDNCNEYWTTHQG